MDGVARLVETVRNGAEDTGGAATSQVGPNQEKGGMFTHLRDLERSVSRDEKPVIGLTTGECSKLIQSLRLF